MEVGEPESAIDTRSFTWRCRHCNLIVMTYGNKHKPKIGIHLILKSDHHVGDKTRELCDCNEEITSNVMNS